MESAEKVHYVSVNSDLGRELLKLPLDYFAFITHESLIRITEQEREVVYALVHEMTDLALNMLNEIDDPLCKFATMGQLVLNLATSCHLALDHAMTMDEIEREFGEGAGK